MNYRPRNEFVLFRRVDRGSVRGVAVPEASAQGKELVIEAIGPEVEDLAIGDIVLAIGTMGEDVVPVPNEHDLYLTRQSNVVAVVQREIVWWKTSFIWYLLLLVSLVRNGLGRLRFTRLANQPLLGRNV